MKRIIFVLILMIFIAGCVRHTEKQGEVVSSEQIGDNAEIITIEGSYKGQDYQSPDIVYETDNQEFQSYFDPMFRPALDWIKEDIEETAVFLGWWDYGHMIRGYTGRDAIVYSPSEDILWSLASGKWDEAGSGAFSSKEKIDDVVLALTTTDATKTKEVMEKYNADYVFVTKRDAYSAFVLFKIAGFDIADYIGEEYQPKEKAQSTILFRMLRMDEIEGFELIYGDDAVRIYRRN